MKQNPELTFVRILQNESHPHYSHYGKFIFRDTTNKSYILSLKNCFSIACGQIDYELNIYFLKVHMLKNILETMIHKQQFSFQFVLKNINGSIGEINYRFGHNAFDMGHKYRTITNAKCTITIIDSFLLIDLNAIASPVMTQYDEPLYPNDKKAFDERYVFKVPFDLVPILLDLNSKERNLFHQYMSKNKRERSVLFDSTSEKNFLTQKETNSYLKVKNLERITNNFGRVFYIYTDENNEHYSAGFIFLDRLQAVKITHDYKKISKHKLEKTAPESTVGIGYVLNTELLSASRIKSVLINTYEKIIVDLPINLMYEGKKLGTLNSPIGKPTVNIEKLNCLIYTKDNQLCLDIEAFGSLDEKERLNCSYYIKIPFKYVPEILDMSQREKDIFNLSAKV